MYERSCEANGWETDDMKINNLKASLTVGSAADKWFSSRIIDQGHEIWIEWKESFLAAFTQNRLQAANKAIRYEYRGGSLMDYYYEKERLLKLAFPDLGQHSFVSHVMLGLPLNLQTQAMSMDPKKKTELIFCLQKLPQIERQRRDHTGNSNFGNKKPETSRDTRPSEQRRHTKQNFRSQSDIKKTGKVNAICAQDNENEEEENNPVNLVNHVLLENGRKLPVFKVKCNGSIVNALLDSGSNINLVSESLVDKHKWLTRQDKRTAEGFDGKSKTSSKS